MQVFSNDTHLRRHIPHRPSAAGHSISLIQPALPHHSFRQPKVCDFRNFKSRHSAIRSQQLK